MLGDEKSVILTFDDGPAQISALESILRTLEESGIKAEFYVLGSEVKQYPEAARTIVRQGHVIKNHSWSHPDLERESEQDVRRELEQTQNIIKTVTGGTPSKFVHPIGRVVFAATSIRSWPMLPGVGADHCHMGYRYRGREGAERAGPGKNQKYRESVRATAARPCSIYSCMCSQRRPETCRALFPNWRSGDSIS